MLFFFTILKFQYFGEIKTMPFGIIMRKSANCKVTITASIGPIDIATQ
jgi:hypothetical protein